MASTDDRLRDFTTGAVRRMRGEPDPVADRPADGWGDGMSFGRPEGWKPQPPDVIADEPDELDEEERPERREPMSALEEAADQAVQKMFPHQGAPRKLDDVLAEFGDGPEPSGPQPAVEDLIAAIYDSADELAEVDESPASRLHWMATCPPQEWAAACAETGWPESVRPGFVDLPREAQVESLRLSLEAEAERLARQGKYIGHE